MSSPLVPADDHVYISTACQHGQHQACREVCKFCGTQCRCGGHATEDRLILEAMTGGFKSDADILQRVHILLRKLATLTCEPE